MDILNLNAQIAPPDEAARSAAQDRWRHVAKPVGSLGALEDDITRIAALTGDAKVRLTPRSVLVMCADNGVAAPDIAITPVRITRVVAEADRRICLGNIEYHYFAGYSGGAKAIMPGSSTPEAIQANHSMMVDERARAGNLKDNPIREDLEEGERMCPADFILNVVLDEHKKIIHAVAGDVTEAHRAGCKFLDSLYQVEIPEKADIVIVSQGGAPKDANLYQTQKALDNSKHAIKPGGSIILVGACQEGMGSAIFEEWMTQAGRPEDLIERIRKNFKLGGHKAAAIAQILKRADIRLVSEMDPNFVRSIFMEPYESLAPAFADAMRFGISFVPCTMRTGPSYLSMASSTWMVCATLI